MLGLKKYQIDIFFLIFYDDFDVLMLKIKKNKKIILMLFQEKSTFEKHSAIQYQTLAVYIYITKFTSFSIHVFRFIIKT